MRFSWSQEEERKLLKKDYREALVKRSVLVKIVVAWIITVPVSAVMAAGMYFMLRGIMVP